MSDRERGDGAAAILTQPIVLAVGERRAAIIRLTVPRPEMATAMPSAIAELKAVLRAQAITGTGKLFAHHLRMDSAVFDLEVGFAIDHAVAETGRVRPGSLPAATVARATYRGGYEGLSAAWGQLRQWIDANGHVRAADLWEVYMIGPEAGPPAEWRTELNQPLRIDPAREGEAAAGP